MLPLLRPVAVSSVYGMVWQAPDLLVVDPRTGYLLAIDGESGLSRIANSRTVAAWQDVTGLAAAGDTLFALRGDEIVAVNRETWQLEPHLRLDSEGNGFAASPEAWYVTFRQTGQIRVYDRQSGSLLRSLPAPGVGSENLTWHAGRLWVSDTAEQSIFCLDPETGQVAFAALTPHARPTGLGFVGEALYVGYSQVEDYIREDPNRDNRLVIDSRSRSLIHKLSWRTDPDGQYTLSTGYRIEMIYCEETDALEPATHAQVVWKIALPAETPRQRLVSIEPIGKPFREVIEDGQRVAVFEFDKLAEGEVQLFGWKAVLDVRSIRYHPDPAKRAPEATIPAEIRLAYLEADDDLDLDTRRVQEAAREAVQGVSGTVEQMLAIRDYVYDRLDYRLGRVSDPPNAVLARGKGSCGEYVGVMLALARLNGIACRTVGRYKCPPHPEHRDLPLLPDYNHVWIEFYLPGYGWLPCESNVDDTGERPYPRRFFLALPWDHIELGKGIPFETTSVRGYSLADLAVNHVQFTIREELMD